MNKQTLLAGILSIGMCATASAHDRDPHHEGSHTYLGAGFADFAVDEKDFGYDADDNGFKLIAGFAFNDYFAAEVGYLGGATIVDEGFFDTEEVELSALTGSLVGRLPITSVLSLFGKLGVAQYETDFRLLVDEDVIATARFRDNEMIYGGGIIATLGTRFELRGEYEAIEDTFDVISLSGVFKF
jgi:Outer membrane protein beta-barrel domain